MKVARFDQAKAVAPGMGRRYGRTPAVPMLVNTSDVPLRGLFDLGKLATRKSSLISPDSALKVSISARRKIKERICTSLQLLVISSKLREIFHQLFDLYQV